MNPNFQYDVVDEKTKQIRLLKLLPRSENGFNITCEFLPPVAISAAVHFEALSYTWGDPTSLRTIYIRRELDEQPSQTLTFNVTANLFAALTALQHAHEPRTLWVDAICINQDSTADKDYQVPLMGQIYARATIVNVWLGPEEAGAPSAFDILDQSTLSTDCKRVDGPDGGPVARDTWSGDITLLNALYGLCCRPYWTRIWIIQEATLARKIRIYSGSRQAEWEMLRAQISALQADASRRSGDEYSDDESDTEDMVDKICRSPCFTILKNGATGSRQRGRLQDLLERYWQNSCGNPRDKVYGLLSLTSDVGEGEIPIRYGQPLGRLYLNVLRFGQRSIAGDWAKMAYLSQLLQRAFGSKSHEVRQGLDESMDESRVFANGLATVFAYATHQLDDIGPSLEEYCLHPKGHRLARLTGLKISRRYQSLYEREAQEFFRRRIWASLHTLNCVQDGESILFRRMTAASTSDQNASYSTEDEIRPPPELDYERSQPSERTELLPAEVLTTLWSRCRFFSINGMLGVITNKAMEGDHISWLKGCYSAIVLRPTEDGFLLVGRAVFLRVEVGFDARNSECFRIARRPTLCADMPVSIFQLITN